MPTSADPRLILSRLMAMTAARPTRPSAFIQTNTGVILAALNAGYVGIDLYRAFVDSGHPPPMSPRQFSRYLARLRPLASAMASPALTPGSDSAARSRPPVPGRPASAPATLHWDPLADDEDIH